VINLVFCLRFGKYRDYYKHYFCYYRYLFKGYGVEVESSQVHPLDNFFGVVVKVSTPCDCVDHHGVRFEFSVFGFSFTINLYHWAHADMVSCCGDD